MSSKTDKSEQPKRSEKSIRQVAINKRLWGNPFKREQLLASMREAWKDPEVKAYRIERIKQGSQKQKQQRSMSLKQHE